MPPAAAAKPRLFSPRLAVALVVAAGLALSLLVSVQVVEMQRARAELEFSRRVDIRHALTREILSNYEAGLFGLRNLFVGDDAVSREEFLQVARDILARYEGITALEWVPVVPSRDRAAFELATSRELGRSFHFTERDPGNKPILDRERPEYYPITYLEPLAGNEPALGLDLVAGFTSASLELARRENRMVLSQALELIQGQRGVVMMWPVYQKPAQPLFPRGKFLGFVQGVFRIGEMFEQTQKREPTSTLDTLYLDRSATTPAAHVLHYRPSDSTALKGSVPTEAEFRAGSYREHVIAIGGREWLVLYRPSAAWLESQTTPLPLVRFCGGLAITGLLA